MYSIHKCKNHSMFIMKNQVIDVWSRPLEINACPKQNHRPPCHHKCKPSQIENATGELPKPTNIIHILQNLLPILVTEQIRRLDNFLVSLDPASHQFARQDLVRIRVIPMSMVVKPSASSSHTASAELICSFMQLEIRFCRITC